MKNKFKILISLFVAVALAALVLPLASPPLNAQSTAPTLGESAGVAPIITVIACTNRVPDNVTESTVTGSAITTGGYRYVGLQMKFALHAAGTETMTFNFVTSADGTNYTTSARPSIAVAANGTTAVVTNVVVDMAGLSSIKILSIVCGNTTTADMTNILVTATRKRLPYE